MGKDEGKAENRGERKNKINCVFGLSALFALPLCLGYPQELCNSQSFFHIKELLEELSKLCGRTARASPTRILNQAFICLLIRTDAKCS